MVEFEGTKSVYVVYQNTLNKYFAGFDNAANAVKQVDNPFDAKWFTNRYDIKLRPSETVVELKIDETKGVVYQSQPFRPTHPSMRQNKDKK